MAGSKKGRQTAHNQQTKKYSRQRARTEANKKKRKEHQARIRDNKEKII